MANRINLTLWQDMMKAMDLVKITDIERWISDLKGPRSRLVSNGEKLREAESYLVEKMKTIVGQPNLVNFVPQARIPNPNDSKHTRNIETIAPQSGLENDGIIIVCAHYDTADESPGANDNMSGVGAILALSKAICMKMPDFKFNHKVQFVFFHRRRDISSGCIWNSW